MVDHLVDTGVVRHHKALEAPFTLEDFLHEVFVGGGRDSVQLVERGHYAECTGVHCGLVRRKVEFPQPAFGHVDGVIVPSALRGPVGGVMLYAG